MLRNMLGGFALITFTLLVSIPTYAASENNSNRIAAMYTTWDDYYFYAAFEVSDNDVVGRNTTPISQPQQDDDIEIFFNTGDAASEVRTPTTYQMAVSSAGGAYFSVGDGTSVPKAKVVYTYKYAAKVDGTLNDPTDSDVGYTIELAIPWRELGQAGPPKSGTAWGFNVISRDQSSSAVGIPHLYSLSPLVTTRSDVQDPSKWSTIVFSSGSQSPPTLSRTRMVSPHITTRFPLINGSVVSGEWPSESRLSFGGIPITAAPPTMAEEPNTEKSPFTQPPPAQNSPLPAPQPDTSQSAVSVDTTPTGSSATPANPYQSIALPGGGSIKVVPGGIKNPVGFNTAPKPTQSPAHPRNPLTAKLPTGADTSTSDVSMTGSLSLTPASPPSLLMAIYRLDYNGDARKGLAQNVWDSHGRTLLIDQPVNAAGPWFSGLRASWHRQQLSDLRRSGIEVALLRASDHDPLLVREVDAMVEALKEMKSDGEDYPLVGVDLSNGEQAAATALARIPKEFRIELPSHDSKLKSIIAYTGDGKNESATLADATPIMPIGNSPKVAVISPGGLTGSVFTGRHSGNTYISSWQKAIDSHAEFVILDSWNDFTRGTEVAASRQYGEQYADQTRLRAIDFNGSKQWHAKYLAEVVPRVVRPGTLYQIPLRIENAGTLPWRAGEGYSLCTRWYKNGRLFDDSAPRIPIGKDVLPGQTANISVGLVAMNGYGEDLEPGEYILVFDIVQDQDRWFSYASDSPLQVPVTVETADPNGSLHEATFLSAKTQTTVESGATYTTHVSLRHEDGSNWTPSTQTLAYKISSVGENGQQKTLVEAVGSSLYSTLDHPGDIVDAAPTLVLADSSGKPLPLGVYILHWFIKPIGDAPAVNGGYDEPIEVISSAATPSFVLSDIPRTVSSGKEATAQLAVQNLGLKPWTKNTLQIGHHWYFLDGQEAVWESPSFASFTKDVPAGRADGDITAKFRVPECPGRYILTWDVRAGDGTWQSTTQSNSGNDLLPVIITVTGNGNVTPVDLAKYADRHGIAIDNSGSGTDFDGHGASLPAEILPPDVVAEVNANPLLLGKPGLPLYSAGYYAETDGVGWNSNHAAPYLYIAPHDKGNDVVTCHGQTINVPGGSYKAIRILAAATGGSAISAKFNLQGEVHSLTIADWSQTPEHIGIWSPYRISGGDVDHTPVYLGDYSIPLNGGNRIDSIALPNAPDVKVLAISLVK